MSRSFVLLALALVFGCGDGYPDGDDPDLAVSVDFSNDACSVKPQTYQIPYPELDGGAFDCVLACKFAVGLQEQGRDPESCKLLGSTGPGDADAGVAASKLECVYTHVCL